MVFQKAWPMSPMAFKSLYWTNQIYRNLKVKYSSLTHPRLTSSIQTSQLAQCGSYSQMMCGNNLILGLRSGTVPLKHMDTLRQSPSFSGARRNMATIIGKGTKPRHLHRCWNYRTYAAAAAVKDISAKEIKAKVRGIQKDISPLTTKRIIRRKKSKGSPSKDKVSFLCAYFINK